jgi:hypothetical protein
MSTLANLITAAQLRQQYRPLSAHIDDARLLVYIDEAERLDVKPLLGDALFVDIKEAVSQTPVQERSFAPGVAFPSYTLLLEGGTYRIGENNVREFAGLKAALAYFAYTRIVENNPLWVTRSGVGEKTDPTARAIAEKRQRLWRNTCRSIARSYAVHCLRYISANADDFPPCAGWQYWNRPQTCLIGL